MASSFLRKKQLSSTWRELRAVHKCRSDYIDDKLANQRIHWFTDNQNVVRILSTGSRCLSLKQEALAICNISITCRVRIEPKWIAREVNQQEQYLIIGVSSASQAAALLCCKPQD